jgi:hypothetical protein
LRIFWDWLLLQTTGCATSDSKRFKNIKMNLQTDGSDCKEQNQAAGMIFCKTGFKTSKVGYALRTFWGLALVANGTRCVPNLLPTQFELSFLSLGALRQ